MQLCCFILLYDTWVIQDTDSTIISIQAMKHSAIQSKFKLLDMQLLNFEEKNEAKMCTNQSTRKKEKIRVECKKTSTGQSLITGVK